MRRGEASEAPGETHQERAPPFTAPTHVIPNKQTRFFLMNFCASPYIAVMLLDDSQLSSLLSRRPSCLATPLQPRRWELFCLLILGGRSN